MTPPRQTSSRRAAVVFNPIKVDEQRLRNAVIRTELAEKWADTVWIETTEEDPGVGQARQAVEAGVEVVIAAGGDGTVRAVAEGLRGSDVALALLPSGTGNLLARNLDLTLDHLEGSIEAAFTGDDRRIDLGVAELERPDGGRDEHVFLVMAGIGLDAQMVVNSNPELKKRVGWLAYIDAIVKSLRDRDRIGIRFQLDDAPEKSMGVHTLLIGNCGSLPGNILLLPEAAVDDGQFDIVALRPKGFIGWAQVWVKIVWENGVLRRSQVGRKIMSVTKEIRTLRYLKGRKFTVRLDRPDEFELDGDLFGEVVAFRTTVDELGISVRLPAGHTLSTDRAEAEVAAV